MPGLVEDHAVADGSFSEMFLSVFRAGGKGEVLGNPGIERGDIDVKRGRDPGEGHLIETERDIALAGFRRGARTRESEHCRVLERGILRTPFEPSHRHIIS